MSFRRGILTNLDDSSIGFSFIHAYDLDPVSYMRMHPAWLVVIQSPLELIEDVLHGVHEAAFPCYDRGVVSSKQDVLVVVVHSCLHVLDVCLQERGVRGEWSGKAGEGVVNGLAT